jgi:hypothetical protein
MTDSHSDDRPRRRRLSPEEREHELEARKRVATLTSGGLSFKIKRDGDEIQGFRGANATKLITRLTSRSFAPEVTLDLRGQASTKFRDAVGGFVPLYHRRGVQQMSIVFEPTPEEDLERVTEALIAAITLGPAAALVRAFATARDSSAAKRVLAVLLI